MGLLLSKNHFFFQILWTCTLMKSRDSTQKVSATGNLWISLECISRESVITADSLTWADPYSQWTNNSRILWKSNIWNKTREVTANWTYLIRYFPNHKRTSVSQKSDLRGHPRPKIAKIVILPSLKQDHIFILQGRGRGRDLSSSLSEAVWGCFHSHPVLQGILVGILLRNSELTSDQSGRKLH